MSKATTFDNLRVLVWVVGSTKGADFADIVNRVRSHPGGDSLSEDGIRDILSKLESKQLITRTGDHYDAMPKLLSAFHDESRNCQDTIEEYDILQRITSS